ISPGEQPPNANFAGYGFFEETRADRTPHLAVGELMISPVDGRGIVPIARRLESSSGEFAGAVVSRLRSEYFQQFYRDIRVDPGTTITLMQDNGRLLARYPMVGDALGKHLPLFETLFARVKAGGGEPIRVVSSFDGVERFVSIQPTAGYPIIVIVARDTALALAPWRAQAYGTAARTLALSALAALLIALLMRQLARLDEARRSVEASQARFAAAVTGSDSGVWELDFTTGQAFSSPRMRELLGLEPGSDVQALAPQQAEVERQVHPEDVERRRAALEAHLQGSTPAYDVDYRARQRD